MEISLSYYTPFPSKKCFTPLTPGGYSAIICASVSLHDVQDLCGKTKSTEVWQSFEQIDLYVIHTWSSNGQSGTLKLYLRSGMGQMQVGKVISAFTGAQVAERHHSLDSLQSSDGPRIGWRPIRALIAINNQVQSNWYLCQSKQNYIRRRLICGIIGC